MGYIKFTVDRSTVEAEPQHFKAGRVYDLPDASCERWLRRQVAVQATSDEYLAQTKADAGPKKGAKKADAVQTHRPPDADDAAQA